MSDTFKHNKITKKGALYCQKLSEISRSYPEESSEFEALLTASIAIQFAMTHEAFEQYCDQFGRELSPAQIKHLESMGIDVIDNDIKRKKGE